MSSASRAIFFDFDGVLADSVDVKTQAFVALYRDHGPEVMERVRAYHLANAGVSRFRKFAYFQKELVNGPDDQDAVADLSRRFGIEVKSRVIAAPEIAGARECLRMLSERALLFVVSATPEEELSEIVEARGMGAFFVAVRGSPRSKDEIVAELISKHRLDPGHCIFVGDAMADFTAAARNGVRFIGLVPDGTSGPFPEGTEIIRDLSGFGACRLKEWAA